MKATASSHLFGVIAAILAATAIIAQTRVAPATTEQVLFGQGAFVSLLRAEEAVKEQHPGKALEDFHSALLRAKREDRQDLANRILLRMGGAGKEMAERSFEAGWPLLSQAALLSSDFSSWAARTEQWLLETGRSTGRFEYVIVDKNGIAEAWGIRPQKAPLWLYRKLSPDTTLAEYPGFLYNLRVADLPATGDYSYCWNFPLRPDGAVCKTRFEVRGTLGYSQSAYLSVDNLVRWQPAESQGAAGLCLFRFTEPPRAYGVDRFLLITNGLRSGVELVAVREYEPL